MLGESTAWDDVVDMGMILKLSAPGMQDTGKAGEIGSDETRIFGEPFEGSRRGLEHGLVGNALMGADKRSQGFRDGEGDEEMRYGKLFCKLVV